MVIHKIVEAKLSTNPEYVSVSSPGFSGPRPLHLCIGLFHIFTKAAECLIAYSCLSVRLNIVKGCLYILINDSLESLKGRVICSFFLLYFWWRMYVLGGMQLLYDNCKSKGSWGIIQMDDELIYNALNTLNLDNL